MTDKEIAQMFAGVPKELFRVHDWRNDVVTAGIVPGTYVADLTGGLLDYYWPAQLNKLVWAGGHDLILSIGQVVPHEVIGMANYNKNLFVGTGGSEGINKSHFVGAVYGMERVMGRADNPVRKLLNYASENFTNHLPIVYVTHRCWTR
jgi:nickel-dependent lactate racemase